MASLIQQRLAIDRIRVRALWIVYVSAACSSWAVHSP